MIRLDKALADKGYGTRKEVKQLVRQKRVWINDELALKDDQKIDEGDLIRIDDEEFVYSEFVYIMLNKPQGVVSATRDNNYPTVLDCITDQTRDMFPVGRLDIDTEGLCLITNDGQLSHQLLSPKHHVDKEYIMELQHELSERDIRKCYEGIELDGELCKPATVRCIDGLAYSIIITEGKYHQIKRMMEQLDNHVVYLKRIRMKNLILDEDLDNGEWRYLTEEEINDLRN